MKNFKRVLIFVVVAVVLLFLFQELPSVATVLSACILFVLYIFYRGNKKAPEEKKDDRERVVARRITYSGDEDEVFYCEFYMRGVHRYGYLEELETPEMEEQVKKGEKPDLKIECYVEGYEPAQIGRWLLTPVNIVDNDEQ